MDILLSTDNNYVMPTGVLMTSVSMNNKDVHYHILVNKEFKDEKKNLLIQTALKYKHFVDFYSIPDSLVAKCPIGKDKQTAYITIASYYRLFVCEILPENVHRVIYLDGDMVVRKSLLPLWNTDLTGVALGVVHDMDEVDHFMSRDIPYPSHFGYFNAGMLLINLDYWREKDCLRRCADFIAENESFLECHDQDVLNCVLYSEKKWLPLTYNFQHGFMYDIDSVKNYLPVLSEEIKRTRKDPAIIHYCEVVKPWHYDCIHPQRFVWDYYKNKSLWASYKPATKRTFREKVSIYLKKNNYWVFEHKVGSLHRNEYNHWVLKK